MATETVNRFEKPQAVTGADLAFGGNIAELLPPMADIPDEFKDWNSKNKWVELVGAWFYSGLKNDDWTAKEGIDCNAAMRHVGACLRSFAPKHEHKMAGCAYLLSLWFDDVTYEPAKG